MPFLVTCALPDELTPFVRRLSRRRNLGGDGHLIVGELIGRAENIAVLHTGMGPGQASRSLGEALERLRPECIIVSGTAGALRPEACVGDLLIASNHGDEGVRQKLLKKLHVLTTENPTLWHEPLHTANQVIAHPEAKRKLAQDTGAFAVDMESQGLVTLAEECGIPTAVLRVISDGIEDRMPLPFERFVREDGFMSMPGLVGHLVLRPWKIPELIRFGGKVRRACDVLAGALVESVTREDLSRGSGLG